MLRILHLADLHLGRVFHGESLIEDQTYLLDQLIALTVKNPPDAVLISGDIYDRALPPVEAVKLFDRLLSTLSDAGITVVAIPGNHDSAGRLAYAAGAWEKLGVHIRADYQRLDEPVNIKSGDGSCCDVFALPFVELTRDKSAFIKIAVESIVETIKKTRKAAGSMRPAILLAHEFVAGSTESGSERLYVGGSQSVPGELFEGFDYVALGHLHSAQRAGDETIRYSGSPMAYAFDESSKEKGFLEIILDNGQLYPEVKFIPLKPLRSMEVLEDSLDNLLNSPDYKGFRNSYISARVTDPLSHMNLIGRLRERFPYLRELRQTALEPIAADNTRESAALETPASVMSDFLDRTGWEEGDERKIAEELLTEALNSLKTEAR